MVIILFIFKLISRQKYEPIRNIKTAMFLYDDFNKAKKCGTNRFRILWIQEMLL